jgi:hypothetical protein
MAAWLEFLSTRETQAAQQPRWDIEEYFQNDNASSDETGMEALYREQLAEFQS